MLALLLVAMVSCLACRCLGCYSADVRRDARREKEALPNVLGPNALLPLPFEDKGDLASPQIEFVRRRQLTVASP